MLAAYTGTSTIFQIASARGGSAAVQWAPTLAGTLGATPQAGDAGLDNHAGSLGNGSGSKYVLSSLNPSSGSGSVVYAADLSYTVQVAIQSYVTKNGLVMFMPTNLTDTAMAIPTSIPANPVIRKNGTTVATYGPVWDSEGTNFSCIAYQLLDGSGHNNPVASTDVIDYTWASGGIVTQLGSSGIVNTPTVIPNYVGRYEPGHAGLPSFAPTRTAAIGMNLGQASFASSFGLCYSKNVRMRMVPQAFQDAGGAGTITYDANGQPLSWTAGGQIKQLLWNQNTSTGIGSLGSVCPEGVYTIKWTDVNAGNPSKQFNPIFIGDATVAKGYCTTGGGPTPGGNAVDTIVGNTITRKYTVSYLNNPSSVGYDMELWLYASSPQGKWGGNDSISGTPTVTNFSIFFPGDEDADQSDPYAVSNYIKNALTAPNGNGPAAIRVMENVAQDGGIINYQDYADCQQPTAWSWGLQTASQQNITITSVRFWNTNPAKGSTGSGGDNTYAWAATPKFYHPLLGQSSDSVGAYMDLNALGFATDCGKILDNQSIVSQANTTAAVKFVCSGNHGLRGGDRLNGGNLGLNPWIIPVTGGVTTAFSGTISVTNGNATITFGTSQTIGDAQGIVFDPAYDSTGQAYRIRTGTGGTVTGTVFTLEPGYQGTTSGVATAKRTNYCNLNNFNAIAWPTSATTFVCQILFCQENQGTTTQTVASTSAIPIGWTLHPAVKGAVAPYGFWAHMAALWPGCRLWIPMQPHMTTACINAICDEIAPYLLTGDEVVAEMGLEHWNQGNYDFPTYIINGIFGTACKYLPAGTTITNRYNTEGAVISIDKAYTIQSARIHDAMQARFDSNWGSKNIKVGRIFGGFVADSGPIANCTTAASTLGSGSNGLQSKIPMSYGAIAPYHVAYSGTTWNHAFAPNGGNWPVALICDWDRHLLKYTTGFWDFYSSNYDALQNYTGPSGYVGQNGGGKPTLIAYEGGVSAPTQLPADTGISTAQLAALHHDVFYCPSFGDLQDECYESYGTGDPRDAGSGLTFACPYHFGGIYGGVYGQQLFMVTAYQGQPAGDGTTNKFTTAQGARRPTGRITRTPTHRQPWPGSMSG